MTEPLDLSPAERAGLSAADAMMVSEIEQIHEIDEDSDGAFGPWPYDDIIDADGSTIIAEG